RMWRAHQANAYESEVQQQKARDKEAADRNKRSNEATRAAVEQDSKIRTQAQRDAATGSVLPPIESGGGPSTDTGKSTRDRNIGSSVGNMSGGGRNGNRGSGGRTVVCEYTYDDAKRIRSVRCPNAGR